MKLWPYRFLLGLILLSGPLSGSAISVTGLVVDAASNQPLPARIYIQNKSGQWFFPQSASPKGTAVPYQKKNWNNANAVEYHTTLSPHPFRVDLDPGQYTITVERGKEYHPLQRTVTVQPQSFPFRLPMQRWVNMAQRGWFSGDTHVHRTVADLPNIVLAEDLNVALPLTYWVTQGGVPPTRGDKTQRTGAEARLIEVDATHVIYPRNTEYEIFSVAGKRHTLGALFVLNHKTPFSSGAPPLDPIVRQARREKALLDLDKHNWPWSMALIPLVEPDLFELANNHHWRTEFSFTNFGGAAPAWMNIGTGRANEMEWTLFGFNTYYTLLNCGFPLRPSAGTANGVHPVPLGFGRVYVYLPDGFSYSAWIEGLNAGRSFVTTGPMLLTQFEGRPPGHRFVWKDDSTRQVRVTGRVLSENPARSVEIVQNGKVVEQIVAKGQKNSDGAWETSFRISIEIRSSGWLAARCWEDRPGGRIRFAHTAPVFFDLDKTPLQPRPEEIQWLIQQTEEEIRRSTGLLPEAALAEYRRALAIYRAKAP